MSSHRSGDAFPQDQMNKTPGAFPASPRSEPDRGVVSAPQSLSLAVKARRNEYIGKKTIKLKVGTWNVAALSGTEFDIGAWFAEGKGATGLQENLSGLNTRDEAAAGNEGDRATESVEDQERRRTQKATTVANSDVPAVPAGEDIGLYVLGLQEIVDINSASEALRPYTDPAPAKKWKKALEEALPRNYKLVAEQQLSGLLLLIYASSDIEALVGPVSTTSVGTGLMGYMRNKGAVCARIILGETTRFVFINCHLAAGSDKAALDRRNWDVGQILSRVRFDPIGDGDEVVEEFGDAIGDEDFGFWFGDLNYRLEDIPPEDVRRLLLLHTRNEYDVKNNSKRKIDSELGYISADQNSSADTDQASQNSKDSKGSTEDEVNGLPLDPQSDPASLYTTLQSLLTHDQLRGQQKNRKAFHDGWREGDINFLPTYKYDVGSVGMFDSGDKKRGPSWCDRILYRTRQDRLDAQRRCKEEEEAEKKDAEMRERGLDKSDDDVIFDSDPGTPGFPGTPGYAHGDEYDEEEDAASESELVPGQNGTDDAITLEYYGSHQRVLSSDHKPLDAVFTISYEAVVPELKAKVHQEVARELDKQENEGRPSVTVVVDHQPEPSNKNIDNSAEQSETNGVNFGEVRYGVPKSAGLTVANTSGVLATFSFVDRPTDGGQKNGIAPSWLRLDVEGDSDNSNSNRNALQEYTLSPGETIYVHLYVEVQDFKLVRKLNRRKVSLDDVLVLQVKDGRDHFIPLSGIWMQTCYGRTLDELVLLPEGGVRQLQLYHNASLANSDSLGNKPESTGRHKVSAPRELFALTEAVQELTKRTVAEWDMTHEEQVSKPPWKQESFGTAWPFEPQSWDLKDSSERSQLLASAREALDTGASLTSGFPENSTTLHGVEVLAETLLTFVQSLEDGIITTELWARLDSHMNTTGKAGSSDTTDSQSWILETLSSAPVHNVAFTFITFMLARIANELVPVSSSEEQQPHSPRLSSSSTRSSLTNPSIAERPNSSTTSPTSPTTWQSQFSIPSLPSFRRTRSRASRTSTTTDDPPVTSASAEEAAATTRRQAVNHAYADIFSQAMIRKPASMKDRKVTKERMRRVLLPFLG